MQRPAIDTNPQNITRDTFRGRTRLLKYDGADKGRGRMPELVSELEWCDDCLRDPPSLNLYMPPSPGAGQRIPLASLVNPATESYKSRKKLMALGVSLSASQ